MKISLTVFINTAGCILRLPIFDKVSSEHLYDDELYWEVPHHEGEESSHHMASLGGPDNGDSNKNSVEIKTT